MDVVAYSEGEEREREREREDYSENGNSPLALCYGNGVIARWAIIVFPSDSLLLKMEIRVAKLVAGSRF